LSTYCADRFAVLTGAMNCHACKAKTHVSAILVPNYREREELTDEWSADEGPALLKYLTKLNLEALDALNSVAPWIKPTPSKTAGLTYLGNQCEQCAALQGDWHTGSPGAPFFPTSPAEVELLQVLWFNTPIEAEADGAQSSWMDAVINRT